MSWEPVRLSAVPSMSWEAGARPALGQSRRARAGQSSWGEVAGVCACTHACKIRWFQLVTWHRPPQRVSGWFPAELFVDISAATWRFGFMGLGLRTRVCFSQGPQVSAGPGLSLH